MIIIKRLRAITISFFKNGWKNLPFYMIPISWVMAPLCIILGYVFLEDYMMSIKESDYKTKD